MGPAAEACDERGRGDLPALNERAGGRSVGHRRRIGPVEGVHETRFWTNDSSTTSFGLDLGPIDRDWTMGELLDWLGDDARTHDPTLRQPLALIEAVVTGTPWQTTPSTVALTRSLALASRSGDLSAFESPTLSQARPGWSTVSDSKGVRWPEPRGGDDVGAVAEALRRHPVQGDLLADGQRLLVEARVAVAREHLHQHRQQLDHEEQRRDEDVRPQDRGLLLAQTVEAADLAQQSHRPGVALRHGVRPGVVSRERLLIRVARGGELVLRLLTVLRLRRRGVLLGGASGSGELLVGRAELGGQCIVGLLGLGELGLRGLRARPSPFTPVQPGTVPAPSPVSSH